MYCYLDEPCKNAGLGLCKLCFQDNLQLLDIRLP